MEVFITGGTGYVGSVLVEHLVAAGHDVRALARSSAAASRLEAAGALPVAGSLADVGVLEAAAGRADAVVHAAVDYAMTEEAQAVELDAVRALLAGAGGHGTPFIYTSTGLVYGFDPAQSRDEDAELPAVSAQPVKAAAERLVLGVEDVDGMVMRAGLVYGRAGSGLVTGLIHAAESNGFATYIGDGENTWTPVHVDDLARLYVAALEHPVPGVYNAVGDTSFTFRRLAEAIAAITGAQPLSISPEQAAQTIGPAAAVLTITGTTSSAKARRTFGWSPGEASIIQDVSEGSYAAQRAAV